MNKSIIFSGIIKRKPNCGISMKNFFMVEILRKHFRNVLIVNLNNYYLLPVNIMKVIVLAILYPRTKIIISSNTWESNILIQVLEFFKMEKRTYYWVPGGVFHKTIKEKFKISTFKKIKRMYVQSPHIVEGLKQLGIDNAIYVPNSKKIDYYPVRKNEHSANKFIKFVFLSRIHQDKGCSMIINCSKRLNSLGYKDRFQVDFYGKIFSDYLVTFSESVDETPNIFYKGYLDLTCNQGYDTLSEYDMMLFPTYWWGEGFPGVVIDAFIAGLPILSSDWNCNKEIVENRITGIIIPAKDEDALLHEMKNVIDGYYDLNEMSLACKNKAPLYNYEKVLSDSNLKMLGIL